MSEMIILKSFYRKKNTRIYLTVITLIFTAIISLFIARSYNVDQANQNLSKSYLRFTANKEAINDIAKIKGISNINYSIIGYLINEETQKCLRLMNSLIAIRNNVIPLVSGKKS